nr:MAG TPA: hypothetical protein [Caudoviricetes sp.]
MKNNFQKNTVLQSYNPTNQIIFKTTISHISL